MAGAVSQLIVDAMQSNDMFRDWRAGRISVRAFGAWVETRIQAITASTVIS